MHKNTISFKALAALALILLSLTFPLENAYGSRLDQVCNIGCVSINGSPLTIVVARDGSYQVYDFLNGRKIGQVYSPLFDEGDAGLFVRYNNYVIGPDFYNHLTSSVNQYDSWQPDQQSLVRGSGTQSSPYLVETRLAHTPSGVTLKSVTSYVNGSSSFNIGWDVCAPGPFTTYLAADYYLQGGDQDLSYGFRTEDGNTVGGFSQSFGWLEKFTAITPATNFFAGAPADLWSAIGQQGAPGDGFDGNVNTTPMDNGAGLQWNSAAGGCAHFDASWYIKSSYFGRIYLPFTFKRFYGR